MKRVIAMVSAIALIVSMHVVAGFATPAAAANPSTENSRSLRYTERYFGERFRITGKASADAPLACNSRMTFSYEDAPVVELTIKANCRIQAGHRDGQDVTLDVTATVYQSGEKPQVLGECTASGASDPKTGKIALSCDLKLDPVEV
ncbi:MAG: hypothetical protein ACKOWF_01755 [Chloroflexota bacterium]